MDNDFKLKKDILGYVASTLYVISLFPEIYAVYKTKKCQLTIYFLLFQMITTILFIVYDIMIKENPLIISDGLLMIELTFLFGYKIYSKKKTTLIPEYIRPTANMFIITI